MIRREEIFLFLNCCASATEFFEKVDNLADLIERGDLTFDAEYNLHATREGRDILWVLPHGTD
jgi:hypothetical protein